MLLPSLREANSKGAHYGDGRYLSDVPPGAISLAQLSRRLVRVLWVGSASRTTLKLMWRNSP